MADNSKQNKQGVNVTDPTSNEKAPEGYAQSDVESLFRRGDWQDWDSMIEWLRENGDADNEFTPGEVKSMVGDFSKLKDKPFPTGQPDKLYDMAHR